MTDRFNRRTALGLFGAAAAMPVLTGAAAAATAELALYGPPAGPSVTLAHAVASGRFDGIATAASFTAWRTPDELRAGLTSGSIQLSVVPVQAAANLYNRGFPIRLANVMTNGLLYVISNDTGISSVADLKGKTVAVPFRGDTPEIILTQLLEHAGLALDSDLDISYAGTPIEAMQLLLAGRVDAALAAEPSSTAAILKARTAGKTISRVIDIQQAWGAMSGAAPVVPQAGLALTGTFIDAHGDMIPALLDAIAQATRDTLADPQAAADNAAAPLGMPAPLLAASVPHCNLVARPAAEARGDVERMLTAMAGADMARIGGKLPDDAFYLS
ncbi:ABC transporter substrate-binding protein [Pukyongiella litopenaei]|uniref:Transporter substrate-binding domain-containing protein n=1 Tax=Pukyongiella litopenaei TaxID=2605946 RepID=A0A2S0MQE1_9RHOB|nr:ABC transporter substrate-binding protein [Pukyongiella litopenaei]AVO37961.1 transporter substrate-binding domain-containing protein [Pukyongiella litopenaei]